MTCWSDLVAYYIPVIRNITFTYDSPGIILSFIAGSLRLAQNWLKSVSFFRHILASLHLNENVRWETQKSKDGEDYVRVNFSKYELGEEVVRGVTVAPTYGKWWST